MPRQMSRAPLPSGLASRVLIVAVLAILAVLGIVFVVLALAMFDVIAIDFTRFRAAVAWPGAKKATLAAVFGMGAVAALLAKADGTKTATLSWATNANVDVDIAGLTAATATLKTQSSNLSSGLSIINTCQCTFTSATLQFWWYIRNLVCTRCCFFSY